MPLDATFPDRSLASRLPADAAEVPTDRRGSGLRRRRRWAGVWKAVPDQPQVQCRQLQRSPRTMRSGLSSSGVRSREVGRPQRGHCLPTASPLPRYSIRHFRERQYGSENPHRGQLSGEPSGVGALAAENHRRFRVLGWAADLRVCGATNSTEASGPALHLHFPYGEPLPFSRLPGSKTTDGPAANRSKAASSYPHPADEGFTRGYGNTAALLCRCVRATPGGSGSTRRFLRNRELTAGRKGTSRCAHAGPRKTNRGP